MPFGCCYILGGERGGLVPLANRELGAKTEEMVARRDKRTVLLGSLKEITSEEAEKAL